MSSTLKLVKFIASVLKWAINNPIYFILIVVGLLLIFYGVIYSFTFLLAPSTYGIKAFQSRKERAKDSVSIFGIIAAISLLLCAGGIDYLALDQYQNYRRLGDKYILTANEMDKIFNGIHERAWKLHQVISNINDSLDINPIPIPTTIPPPQLPSAHQYSSVYKAKILQVSSKMSNLHRHRDRFDLLINDLNRIRSDLFSRHSILFNNIKKHRQHIDPTLNRWFRETEEKLEELIDGIKIGTEHFENQLNSLEKYLPEVETETLEIENSIQEQLNLIKGKLSKSTSTEIDQKPVGDIPNFKIEEFKVFIDRIMGETSAKLRSMGKEVKYFGMKGLTIALVATIASFGAIFMNRLQWPLFGSASLIIIIILVAVNMAQSQNNDKLMKRQLYFSKHFDLKGKGQQVSKPVEFKVADHKISSADILEAVKICSKKEKKNKSLSTVRLLKKVFGKGAHFHKHLIIKEDAIAIRFKNISGGKIATLLIPANYKEASEGLVQKYEPEEEDSAVQKKSFSLIKGSNLEELINIIHGNARKCRAKALCLHIPPGWKLAMEHTSELLVGQEIHTNSLKRLISRIRRETYHEQVDELLAVLGRFDGIGRIVRMTSERVISLCDAQDEAAADLRESLDAPIKINKSSSKTGSMSNKYGEMRRRLKKIFKHLNDASFLRQPIQNIIQMACRDSRIIIEKVQQNNSIITFLLLGSALALILVSRIPKLISRGIAFFIPCLSPIVD